MPSDHVTCPWCGKGRTFVEKESTGKVTVKCAKCQHCYIVDLKTLAAKKAPALTYSTNGKAYNK